MSEGERYADVSFVLLLVPFIASAVYGLVLWAEKGASLLLPESVYLQVSKDPYLFLLGFTSVMIASFFEITGQRSEQRSTKAVSLSKTIQTLAALSVVLSLLAAWYANGFNIGSAVFDLLGSRFSVIFPALLIIFSFVVLPSVRLKREQTRTIAIMVCFLAVPAVVYEVGKRNTAVGLSIALILMAIGIFVALGGKKKKTALDGNPVETR